MFSKEFLELLTDILKSWQVIAITIVLAIYMYIVSYVSRAHHRPMSVKKVKTSAKKEKVEQAPGPEETESSLDSNDELGLEEA
ncbi:MAG: RNA polymerase I-specific transcription initiation factor RRN3 family protein [Treponema sp.]|nr:RNA polymerase I-specific transcription initiation factor RRN3 family protein [Treponema sp.]